MTGQRLGRLSLRLDSVYCLILGSLVAVTAPALSGPFAVARELILLAGIVVVLWAGSIEWMRARLELRLALRIVMIVNLVAAVAVALTSLAAAALIALLGVVAIAIDIALFAGSQALALNRLRATWA